LVYFKYYLPAFDYEVLILEVKKLLETLSVKLHPNAYNSVRANIGVKDIAHLDLLLTNQKKVNSQSKCNSKPTSSV
jgi:elongation factor P--beta-lysine ligase